MSSHNFRFAGWIALTALAAFICEVIAFLLQDIPAYSSTLPAFAAPSLLGAHVVLASIAFLQLRKLLVTRYDFVKANTLIVLLVGGGVLLAVVTIAAEFLDDETVAAAAMLAAGIFVGIVSILFGYRLLGVNGRLGGFKKPLAFAHIVAPVAFMTVVLAPLGLLMLLVAQALLAMIFLSRDEGELEFV